MMLEEYRLKAQGRLTICREVIKGYQTLAEEAPNWIPGAALQSECRQAIYFLDQMEERLDRKLVITLIGPSGAGKSTLLNALAEKDELSPIGIQRPTTTGITVFCRAENDADVLLKDLGGDVVSIRTSPVAASLKHVILVDTPDMDSTESEKYRPVLEKAIGLSDILFCVLNAENPKRRDSIVFLKRFVDYYPGSQLYVVLNRCDRLQEDELKQVILPDLKNHLQTSWQRPVESIFCISARRHLQHPQWPQGEKPLHNFDDYRQLHGVIFGSLNQGNRFVDSRVERAQHLVELIRKSAALSIDAKREELSAVKKEVLELEKNARIAATDAMQATGAEMLTGIHAIFYQKLAGRWWGPVGWLVAIWARFLMAGAGVLATLRLGNPIVQLWGLLSSLVRYRKTRVAVTEASTGGDMAPALLKYRLTIQQAWPDIAQKLVSLEFRPSVRDISALLPDNRELRRHLTSSWKSTFETVVDRRAASASGFLLQLLFNLPTLGLMGLFAYQSVKSYLLQNTLPSGYFLHAAISILLVWMLSFVLLQIIIRFAGGTSLLKRAFGVLVNDIQADEKEWLSSSIVDEVDNILRLSD